MSFRAKDMRYHSLKMLVFVLRRLAQAVVVMLAVGLIAFSLFRFVGDPVQFMLGQDATPEDVARITKLLGLDRQFGDARDVLRSEEHTSELQSHVNLVCRLLLEKKNKT